MMSFRVQSVIPSAARNLIASRRDCRLRFFTPLRSVQNDMGKGLRFVQNDMEGLRFVQNDMGKGLRFVQNDMGRGCASFRMTWLGTAPRCHSECDLSFRAQRGI